MANKPAMATSKNVDKANKVPASVKKPPLEPKTVNGNTVKKVPMPATPKPKAKPKEKKVLPPSSVTKSAKKSWQRRPKAAHSGVPIPEKLKKILQQQFQDSDNSL